MLLFTYILTSILQISNIKDYKKEKSEDKRDQIYGLFIANVISCVIVLIIYHCYDISHDIFTNDSDITLDYYGISFIHLIIHSMLFFGTAPKLKINSNVIVTSLITIIINAAGIYMSVIVPANEYHKSFKARKAYVIYYLKETYGDGNFQIVGTEKEYSNSSMFGSDYLDEYIFSVKSDYTKKNFYVSIEYSRDCINSEDFLIVYYMEKYGFNSSEELSQYIKSLISQRITTGTDRNAAIKDFDIYDDLYRDRKACSPTYDKKIPTLEKLIDNYLKYK